MEVQHLNIKIYADDSSAIDLAQTVIIFHRWIQESVLSELLIDVADYSHVPSGPGIILVGHDAFYSLEYGPEQRLGLLYNRRTRMDGDNQQRIINALQCLLQAKQLLEAEINWQGKLRFSLQEFKLLVNDRYFGQDKANLFQAISDDIRVAFAQVLDGSTNDFALTCEPDQQDKRELFTVLVHRKS